MRVVSWAKQFWIKLYYLGLQCKQFHFVDSMLFGQVSWAVFFFRRCLDISKIAQPPPLEKLARMPVKLRSLSKLIVWSRPIFYRTVFIVVTGCDVWVSAAQRRMWPWESGQVWRHWWPSFLMSSYTRSKFTRQTRMLSRTEASWRNKPRIGYCDFLVE